MTKDKYIFNDEIGEAHRWCDEAKAYVFCGHHGDELSSVRYTHSEFIKMHEQKDNFKDTLDIDFFLAQQDEK